MTTPSATAVIPARAGSKRLPGKNVAEIGGLPLVSHTIAVTLASGRFSRIVLSSDDLRVLELGAGFAGIEVRRRPPHLATDGVTNTEVALEIVAGDQNAIIGLLQPTSPLRTVPDIHAAFDRLAEGYDAVIGVVAQGPIARTAFEVDSSTSQCRIPESLRSPDRGPAQNQPALYHPNGAIYLIRRERLLATRSFFSGRVGAVIMPRERSVDIDDAVDLELARALWRREHS